MDPRPLERPVLGLDMGSGLFVLSVRIAVIIPMHQSVLSCIGRGDDGRRRGVEEHSQQRGEIRNAAAVGVSPMRDAHG